MISYNIYADVFIYALNHLLSLVLTERNYLGTILPSWHMTLKPAFLIEQIEPKVIKHRGMTRIHLALRCEEAGLPFRS